MAAVAIIANVNKSDCPADAGRLWSYSSFYYKKTSSCSLQSVNTKAKCISFDRERKIIRVAFAHITNWKGKSIVDPFI